jgi:cellulose synthase/poly-beta-1,6-N-acetylglucosamine synthase-like glycosyltransferase
MMSIVQRLSNLRPAYDAGQRILHPFRPGALPIAAPDVEQADQRLAATLLREGLVPPHQLIKALAYVKDGPAHRLVDVLLERNLVDEAQFFATLQRHTGYGRADLAAPFDPSLIDDLGASFCLVERILPLRRMGGATLIAAAHPDSFVRHHHRLAEVFGQVLPSLAPSSQIEARILAARGPALAQAAETTVAQDLSCRTYRKPSRATLWLLGVAGVLAILAMKPLFLALAILAVLTLTLSTGLKLAALIASLRACPPETPNRATEARLPTVSILVALYRENDIAARLVQRLGRLDYPRALLDVVLAVEEDDTLTRRALKRTDLPGWMRVVVTPAGRVKTKPRALNHALTQCNGTIVGIYDAEDAPAADQLRKVVNRFAQSGPEVACLQGALDFYNPTKSWLARCFTLEYAAWFRVILPGLQRLGMPLPLGGTTLFFRREVLEKLGAWDAYNVTEDADLGIRLARHGYRTEILPSTTLEEANCQGLSWVNQRSRWVKGYMMTYITHMRAPKRLWRDLGPRGFLGFQIVFLGSIVQALLAPVLWSFWAFFLGLGHPLSGVLGPQALLGLTVFFMGCEALSIAVGVLGLKRSGQNISALWVPTLALYFPLQTLAAYKAAYEMLVKPFYWDKTPHGAFHQAPVFSAASIRPHQPAAVFHRPLIYAP